MSGPDRRQREAMHGDEYVQQFSHHRQIARVARLVGRVTLGPNVSILDAGCGTGVLAGLLAPHYGAYTGVDFSPAMVQKGRARVTEQGLTNCQFLCVDLVEHMRESRSTYDAIFMLDISEHVPDKEWESIVSAAFEALKPRGKVYLHTPNLDFWVERLKQRGWIRQFPEHVAVRDAKCNGRFFHDAGFTSVALTTLPHYNVLRLMHVFAGLPVVGRYFAARLWIVAVK